MCSTDDSTIHSARLSPSDAPADQGPASSGRVHPRRTDTRAVAPSLRASSATPSLFQRANVPTTMKIRTGTMIGTNTALK